MPEYSTATDVNTAQDFDLAAIQKPGNTHAVLSKAGLDGLGQQAAAATQFGRDNRQQLTINERLSREMALNILHDFDIDPTGENDSTAGIQQAIDELATAVQPVNINPNAPAGGHIGGILQLPRGFYSLTKAVLKYGVELEGAGRASTVLGAIQYTHDPATTKSGNDTEYGLIEIEQGPIQYGGLHNMRLQGHTANWDAQTTPTNPGQRPIYTLAKWNADDNTATDGGWYYNQLTRMDIRAFDRGPWIRGGFHKNINNLTNQFLKVYDVKCFLEHPIIDVALTPQDYMMFGFTGDGAQLLAEALEVSIRPGSMGLAGATAGNYQGSLCTMMKIGFEPNADEITYNTGKNEPPAPVPASVVTKGPGDAVLSGCTFQGGYKAISLDQTVALAIVGGHIEECRNGIEAGVNARCTLDAVALPNAGNEILQSELDAGGGWLFSADAGAVITGTYTPSGGYRRIRKAGEQAQSRFDPQALGGVPTAEGTFGDCLPLRVVATDGTIDTQGNARCIVKRPAPTARISGIISDLYGVKLKGQNSLITFDNSAALNLPASEVTVETSGFVSFVRNNAEGFDLVNDAPAIHRQTLPTYWNGYLAAGTKIVNPIGTGEWNVSTAGYSYDPATNTRADATAYALGAVYVAGDGSIYEVVTAGTTGTGTAPTGTGDGQADGTVVWDYVAANQSVVIAAIAGGDIGAATLAAPITTDVSEVEGFYIPLVDESNGAVKRMSAKFLSSVSDGGVIDVSKNYTSQQNQQNLQTYLDGITGYQRHKLPGLAGVVKIDNTVFSNKNGVLDLNENELRLDTTLGPVVSTVGNTVEITGHGLAANDHVLVHSVGGNVPGGLAIETLYYAIVIDANQFQLAATSNGSAITLADTGTGTLDFFRPPLNVIYCDPAYNNDGVYPSFKGRTDFRYNNRSGATSIVNGTTTRQGTEVPTSEITLDVAGMAAQIEAGASGFLSSEDPARTGEVLALGQYSIASIDTATDTITFDATHNLTTGAEVHFVMNIADDANVLPRTTETMRQTVESISSSNERFTITGHGLVNAQVVYIESDGAIPAPLQANTKYYVTVVTNDLFTLSDRPGGRAINLTDTGSGTIQVFSAPDLERFKIFYFIDTAADGGQLALTAADAAAGTQIDLTYAGAGTHSLYNAWYREKDVVRVFEVDAVNNKLITTRLPRDYHASPEFMQWKGERFMVVNGTISYVPHQRRAGAVTGWWKRNPSEGRLGIDAAAIFWFGYKHHGHEKVHYRHTPSAASWACGALTYYSEGNTFFDLLDQTGDFDAKPASAPVGYGDCYTGCFFIHIGITFGIDTRHDSSSRAFWTGSGQDPAFKGRNGGANVVWPAGFGNDIASQQDTHRTDKYTNFHGPIIGPTGGNGTNMRSSGSINSPIHLANARIGQLFAGPDDPIHVRYNDVNAKDVGPLEVKDYATAVVNGVIEGQLQGLSAKMIDVSGKGAVLVTRDLQMYTRDVQGDLLFASDHGKIFTTGRTVAAPMPGLPGLSGNTRFCALKSGENVEAHFGGETLVLGSGWNDVLGITGVLEDPIITGVIQCDNSFNRRYVGGCLIQPMDANNHQYPYKLDRGIISVTDFKDATPDLNGAHEITLSTNGPYGPITDFTGGNPGEWHTIFFGANLADHVVDFSNTSGSSKIRGNGGVDFTPTNLTDSLQCKLCGDGNWYCIAINT